MYRIFLTIICTETDRESKSVQEIDPELVLVPGTDAKLDAKLIQYLILALELILILRFIQNPYHTDVKTDSKPILALELILS